MNHTKCSDCGQAFPINETFKLDERTLCNACAEKLLQMQKGITKEQIQRQLDPTVCVNCGADNASVELKKMAGMPTCEQCTRLLRNRPFPTWIKGSLAGLAVIVIFSFIWNWRFMQAYMEIRSSNTAIQSGNLEAALKRLHSAAANVPEVKSLSSVATFYEGALMLKEDKSAEAIKLLTSCKTDLPPGLPVDEMLLRAKIGVAFNNKDYDKFLKLAIAVNDKNPNDPALIAQVASAYACKYAVTGDEQFKQQSLDFLRKSKTMAEKQGVADTSQEYEDRILYRLETRHIIDRKDFVEKFPSGWKQRQKEQSE
jgi:hypothetical protein